MEATVGRTRRYQKRTRFGMPERVARPVRALWEGASEEDRSHAEAWRCRVCGYRDACDQRLAD